MRTLEEFFESRSAGFYVSLAAAALSIITPILYVIAYAGTVYMSWIAFALPFVAAALFVGLAFFKQTERLAPLVMGIVDFVAFLLFIHAVYLYLSEVFFGGISLEAILNINPLFILCTLFFLACVVLSNIGVYMKQSSANASVEENA